MFIEQINGADEIPFKYLGEIENFILKHPKRQTLISNYFSILLKLYLCVLNLNLLIVINK